MHYFTDRKQAGQMLASKIQKSSGVYVNPAVIAINEGGAVVAAEIAKKLHAALYMLTTADVDIPGEGFAIGVASSEGNFTYNGAYSSGQLDELRGDYRQVIDQERYKAFQKLNRIVGKDGIINIRLLKRHEIILVSDGIKDPLGLEIAMDFLKPVSDLKVIAATPIASINAVDRMHILVDEIFCLGVAESYFSTEHYYQNNQIPDHKTAVEMVKNIVFSW